MKSKRRRLFKGSASTGFFSGRRIEKLRITPPTRGTAGETAKIQKGGKGKTPPGLEKKGYTCRGFKNLR